MVAVVLIVVGLVAVVPTALAPFLSARLSAAAGVPVHVGWVTWNPLASRIVLHHLTLALMSGASPVVTVRSITADLALRRLLAGDLAFHRLTVRDPWVALRRTVDGDFDLGAVLAAPTSAAAPDSPVRSIVVEQLRVDGGSIEFKDETVRPALSTSMQLEDVTADDLEVAFTGRTDVQLDLASRIEEAPVQMSVAYRARGADSRLKIDLRTKGVSLARTLFYVPLGWREASGALDATLSYTREVVGGHLRAHAVTGHAVARDLALADPGATEPRVQAKRVRVGHLDVDLVARRTTIRAIELTGFQAIVAREPSGIHIPFLTADAGPTDTPWRTVVGDVTFGTGEVVLRDVLPGADPELRAAVRTGSLRTGRDGAVTLMLRTTTSAGEVDLEGRFDERASALRFALRGVALPELADRLRLPLRFATGTVEGTLELDPMPAEGPRLQGELRLSGGKTAPDPTTPTDVLAWQDLTLELAEARFAPARFHFRRVTAEWPYAMVHRTASGVFPLTLASATTSAEQRAGDAAPAPSVTIDGLALHHGRVEYYDTTLQPPFWTELSDGELSGETLTWTPLAATRLEIAGAVDELSPLRATARIDASDARIDLDADRLRLPPLNPYLEPILQYAITSGSARVSSKVTLTGTRISSTNDLVLSRFGMARTGEERFQKDLGAPLSVTLALMKDYRGDIRLTLPIEGDIGKGEYEVGNLVSSALSRALVGAVQSPVKLLGSLFRRDEDERFDLKPVPFAAGSAQLGPDGEARIADVARLLGRHDGLDVVLLPDPSPADATALAPSASATAPADALARLADARLRVVVDRLVGTHGLAPARVASVPWTPGPPQPETVPGVDVQLRGH
ncbi:MAG TPA: DUF748 domain-containing protein [Candidatus Binatia bacterium]